jgi:hypothetical protein
MRQRRGGLRLRGRRGVGAIAAVALFAAFALLLSACGGSDTTDPRVLPAGQVDIKLPPGFKVVNNKVIAPRDTSANTSATTTPTSSATGTGAPGANVSVTPTTAKSSIPLSNKNSSTSDLLGAMGKFQTCLKDTGVKFIGAPDAKNPSSPTNDPNYIKGLSTCAARSNIVQALKAQQSSENNLTPAEIKTRNKGFLKWRSCMISRGWKISVPTPDSQGRLFSFGGGGGNGPKITAPAGKDILNSSDTQQCASVAQKATGIKG